MRTLRETGAIRLDEHFLADHAGLFAALVASLPWDERIKARKVASFGVPYNYSGILWPDLPFPPVLVPVLDRVADHLGFRPNNCLTNFYPDGTATMGFHRDDVERLTPGTGIAVLSLGADRAITFRYEPDRTRLERYLLSGGSVLHMTAEMQTDWKHAILADESAGGRISLTFRHVWSENGRPV